MRSFEKGGKAFYFWETETFASPRLEIFEMPTRDVQTPFIKTDKSSLRAFSSPARNSCVKNIENVRHTTAKTVTYEKRVKFNDSFA